MSRAWLLLAVGNDRQHGGNDGYDDDPDAHYSWDSTVPNHAALSEGDRVVLWDKQFLIGASVIETIEEGRSEKVLKRCRYCKMAGIKARKDLSPRYKCYKCGSVFDDPIVLTEKVKTYRSRHDAGWVNLEGLLDGPTLRLLCHSAKSQLSLRPLDWDRFVARLGTATDLSSLDRLARRTELVGGHVHATVRVRRGQRAFRQRLLEQQGLVCAFTGPAPARVLEAGHLYSYANVGEHHDHGGLLLRRDVHRLFDDGDLAIDPITCKIDVREELKWYPVYASLMGAGLHVPLSSRHREWLDAHWTTYRSG